MTEEVSESADDVGDFRIAEGAMEGRIGVELVGIDGANGLDLGRFPEDVGERLYFSHAVELSERATDE